MVVEQHLLRLADLLGRQLQCNGIARLLCVGITERDVLERCHRGLIGEGAVVNEAEAQWVIRRLAELLEW